MANPNISTPPNRNTDGPDREYKCNNCEDVFESCAITPECPHCNSDDVSEISPCCGEVIDEDIRICPQCKEHV